MQTVMQLAVQEFVFLGAGNVIGGDGTGLATTRIRSSIPESQEEGGE